jgi:hypothetical protein
MSHAAKLYELNLLIWLILAALLNSLAKCKTFYLSLHWHALKLNDFTQF